MTVLYGHNLRNGRMFAQLNDFADADDFTAYFDAVQAQKSLQSNFRTDAWPEPSDRVLTLSTCFRGDNHQRYLVQGKLVAEAYAN